MSRAIRSPVSTAVLHHRLAVVMALMGLIAYAGGAGEQFLTGLLAAAFLVVAFFWRPPQDAIARLERIWLPLALLLVARALIHAFILRDDLVLPVVDLLLLLLVAESFRPTNAQNDARMYALSFALLLAATAYRPGLLYAFGFAGYVALAVPTFMIGHLKRKAVEHGRTPPRIPRSFILRSAIGSFAVLMSAIAVFLLFPRASQAWSGRVSGPVASVAGFRDRVALGAHGATIQSNPAVVLRVEFPQGPPGAETPLYWRGRSYDRFDGRIWSRTRGLPPSSPPASWYESAWTGPLVRQEIYATRLDTRVLFALHPVVRVRTEGTIQPIFDNAGDWSFWGAGAQVYTAFSGGVAPSPAQLRAAEGRFIPPPSRFLQVPTLAPEMSQLAARIVGDADNTYDKAIRIRDWFHSEFSYTLELPDTPAQATLEHFLFERRAGHCEYFSTGMAIMLRTLGIPAREVNGFLGGEWNEFGGYLAVTQNQAHSWVEVWFPGYGWLTFDPTPPGTGAETASLGWNWPGRFFVDGLRHRWNKWVLDYDAGIQISLLDEMRANVDGSLGGSTNPDSPGLPGWLEVTMVLAALSGGWFLMGRVQRRRRSSRAETRLFQRLRQRYSQLGVNDAERLGPTALIRAANDNGLAGPAARSFVQLYLRARFHADGLDASGQQRLRSSFEAANRELA